MQRHIKSQSDGDYQQVVAPGTMKFLDFARLRLPGGGRHSGSTGTREAVLDVFSGSARVSVDSLNGQQEFPHVGDRAAVFGGPPVMVYIPPQCRYEISATSPVFDSGIFSAPSKAGTPQVATLPALLQGTAVIAREVGR